LLLGVRPTDRQAILADAPWIGRADREAIFAVFLRREDDAGVHEAGAVVVVLELRPLVILEPEERIELVAFEVDRVGLAGRHLEVVRLNESPLPARVGLVALRELLSDLEDDRAA